MSVAEPHAEPAKDYPRADYPPPITPKVSAAHRPPLSIDGILAILRHPLMVVFLSARRADPGLQSVLRHYPVEFTRKTSPTTTPPQRSCGRGRILITPLWYRSAHRLGLHTKTFKHDEIIPETPAFLLCLKTLGALPLTRAYWTWIAINFAALLASFYLLLGPGTGIRPVDACVMIALALIYPPLIDLFLTAQSQVLVILGLALSVRWLARGRDGLAGLMLAALTLLRGYPALMGLYLLLTRRWRALAFMAMGGAIGLVVCAALMGWHALIDFPLGLAAAGGDRELYKLGWNTAPASLLWRVCLYLNGWHLGPAGDRFATRFGLRRFAGFHGVHLEGHAQARRWSRSRLAPVRSMGSYLDRGFARLMAELQYFVVRSVRVDRFGGGAQPGQ